MIALKAWQMVSGLCENLRNSVLPDDVRVERTIVKLETLDIAINGGSVSIRGLDGEPAEIADLIARLSRREDFLQARSVATPNMNLYIEPDDIPDEHQLFASVVELEMNNAHIIFSCWALDKLVQQHWLDLNGPKDGRTQRYHSPYGRIWNDALSAAGAALTDAAKLHPGAERYLGVFLDAIRRRTVGAGK